MARWFGFLRGNVLVITVCECVWRSSIDIIWPFLSLYVLDLGGGAPRPSASSWSWGTWRLIFYPLGAT